MSAQRNRPRWRRLAWAAAIALVLGAIVWQWAKRAIDVDQYRHTIETALSEYTGLAVSIDELRLAWHPVPCLSAHGIQIGADDFRATAKRLDVFPTLMSLLRGQLEIARIDLVEPDILLPATFAQIEERVRGVIEHIRRAHADPDPSDSGARLRIDEVLAKGASLQLGGDPQHRILASLTAGGIGRETLALALEAEMPSTGARASVALELPVEQGGELKGRLELAGVRPDQFVALPEVAHTEWTARAQLAGQLGGALALAAEGAFEPRAKAAIGGTFLGEARIAADGATQALLAAKGDGLELKGTAQLFGERSSVRIDALRVQGNALRALLSPLVSGPVELSAESRGAVSARDLEIALTSPPRIASGSLEASGISATWRDKPLASGLRLDARAAEGAIRIAELRGGPIDLRGVITPDANWHHFALDLTGTLAIDQALLHAFGAPAEVVAASGTLAVDELRAELPQRDKEPPSYSVRAQLSEGSLQYESESIAETLSDIQMRLSGDPSGLSVDASATGAGLGPVALDAQIEPVNGAARGTLTLGEARAEWLRDEVVRERLAPILSAYGQGTLGFELARAEGEKGVQTIRAVREQPPRISLAVALREKPADDRVRDLDLSADVPADTVRGFLPEEARVTGAAALRLRREGGGAGFIADADFAGLGVRVGEHLEKEIGEPLRARVEGEIAPGWTPRVLLIQAANDAIPLVITEDGVVASDVEIDLADWSFLLADEGRATGRVRWNFDSAAEKLALQLSDVAIALSPDVGVDAADGEITAADGGWALRDLHVRGAQSDAVVNLAVADDRLTGKVTGAALDADFVREVWQQVDAFLPDRHEPDSTPISGDLSIALDRVGYGHAEAQQFTAAVQVERDDIHVRDIAFAFGEGRVSGRVDFDSRTPEPLWVDADLAFTNLSRRFLEQVREEEIPLQPGTFTGTFALRAPLRDDWRDMMPDASGAIVGTGSDGSFGRIGIVTKLITVLRTTAPLRMRLPPFSDEGLVFDHVRYDIAMESGRMEIRTFELDSISYAVSGTGEVDFRNLTTRIPIELNAIRGLTAIVERVPVAGDALKIVNVRLIATGSPWDMQLSVASIQDQLIGAGMAGPKAVIKGVRDALELLRRASPSGAPAATSPEAPPPAPPQEPLPQEPAPPPPKTPEEAPAPGPSG